MDMQHLRSVVGVSENAPKIMYYDYTDNMTILQIFLWSYVVPLSYRWQNDKSLRAMSSIIYRDLDS